MIASLFKKDSSILENHSLSNNGNKFATTKALIFLKSTEVCAKNVYLFS